jgi:flavin reductase (DIM6/NTAB) family NADH-FMN oxidoreductase RutF
MTFSLKESVLLCGTRSGETLDKFKAAEFHKLEADTIDCPIIAQATAYLECEVTHEYETGDHVIFVGKVTKSKILREGKRILHLDGADFSTTR